MKQKQTLDPIKKTGAALAFLLYPLLAGIAFAVHPNLLSLRIDHDLQVKISEFHGNQILHFGHFLMLVSAPLLLVIALHSMQRLETSAPWWGFIGGCLAITGAFILAADKGALCLVPSAFDTLPETDFQNLTPGIAAMFQYRGWLWVLWLLPLLPIGFVIQSMGLVRSRQMPRWQSLSILTGSLLMVNPDIDLIGLAATVFLAIGFVPYAFQLLKEVRQSTRQPLDLVNHYKIQGG